MLWHTKQTELQNVLTVAHFLLFIIFDVEFIFFANVFLLIKYQEVEITVELTRVSNLVRKPQLKRLQCIK